MKIRRVRAIAIGAAVAVIGALPMSPASAAAGAPVSDDFHAAALNASLWSVENPVGNGSVAVNGTQLVLSVPGGSSHDTWSDGLNALRVVQPVANSDFEVESKFESMGAAQYQDEGILVEQDASTVLRFDVFNAGGSIVLFAASISGATASVKVATTLSPAPAAPFWMRVKRTGSTWLFTYSTNGTTWVTGGSFSFAMTVAKIGPYAGNSGTPAPAWTANVDYFFNTASPIVPEDGAGADTTPPVISAVAATPASTSATVAWTTNEASSSRVDSGATATYGANVSNASLLTAHSLVVTGLACATTYHYKVTSADAAANSASSADATFKTSACVTSGAPVSDDFHAAALNASLWSVENPVGNGSVSVNGTQLVLSVPGGSNHDTWSDGLNALRVVQPVANADFEVESKFESMGAAQYQDEGILVEQDASTVLRFDVFNAGGSVMLFAASVSGATASVKVATTLSPTPTAPFWLRVKRTGSTWLFTYSTNGTTWVMGGSFSFAMMVAKIGPYAGNSGTPAPAWTANVDYFFNTASPIVPEDGAGGDTTPPVISGITATPTQASATIVWTTNEASSSRVDSGATAAYGANVSSAALVTAHSLVVTGLACATTYHYKVTSADAAANSASSADATFTTSACSASGVPVSDDFHAGTLNSSLWSTENPVGNGSVSVNGHALVLSVPAGSDHDMWSTGLNGLRVVQPVANSDFEVESKFESMGAAQYQDEGIVVEQDASTMLRFDVYNAGGSIVLFAASISGTTASVKVATTLSAATAPFWMRVKRTGSTWLFTYSLDGSTWVTGGSFTFAMTVAKVGPYAGNSGTPPPAWAATVDYFFNTASPIVPEDGGSGVTTTLTNDDFSAAALNANTWTFTNPGGGATQAMDGQHAVINVPAGSNHDPATSGDGSPRVMQTIANSDLSVDAKFDSQVTLQFQEQGVIVEQDSTHYVYASIAQNYFETAFVVKTVSGSTVTTVKNVELYNKASIMLRVTRTGSSWTFGYSYDGLRWTAAASTSFAMTVARAGVFGGNFGGASSPAFSAKVDYFVNSTAPPATEDGVAWPTAPASPVINLWYGSNETFGAKGQPQQWVNVLGDVSDPKGLASLTYTLNGGAANSLSLGENVVRLVAPGEFNVEMDYASLQVGANTVVLKAVDNFGNTSTSTVTVTKVNGGPWALPYTANWASAGGNPNTIAQVADGHWVVQADGTIRNSDIGYDRLVTIGQASTWTQYQGTAQVTINSLDPDGAAVGIIAGFKGATSDLHGIQEPDQPRIGHPFPGAFLYGNDPAGAPAAQIYENTDAHQEQTLVGDSSGLKLTLGVAYTFKFSVTDNALGGSLYKFKIWKTATAEPAAWLLQANGDLSRGAVVLAAHRADVNFGTVTITSAP